MTSDKGRIDTSTFGHVWKDEIDPVNLLCGVFRCCLTVLIQKGSEAVQVAMKIKKK